jgi:hypothetical protein
MLIGRDMKSNIICDYLMCIYVLKVSFDM